jgi:nitrate/nitrite transport system substrate-binding protein
VAAAIGVATASSLIPGLQAAAYGGGSDKPEKEKVRIGFIPLIDCASVVMASVRRLDEQYGVKIIPSKEASWAGRRCKLVNGEFDMAHVLCGLTYGAHLGVDGVEWDTAVLMTHSNNGQAITVFEKLVGKGTVDGVRLAKLMAAGKRQDGAMRIFAQAFPTGTHAMALNYWTAANGINPIKDAKIITVTPA